MFLLEESNSNWSSMPGKELRWGTPPMNLSCLQVARLLSKTSWKAHWQQLDWYPNLVFRWNLIYWHDQGLGGRTDPRVAQRTQEKFEQDWTILRGVLAWSTISLYPRHLHSQYMYFGLNMYFLSNTLLNSLLQVPTLAHQVVYWLTCALLGKFWEHLNPTPATPTTGLLELIYHTNNHCYTGCNSETCI